MWCPVQTPPGCTYKRGYPCYFAPTVDGPKWRRDVQQYGVDRAVQHQPWAGVCPLRECPMLDYGKEDRSSTKTMRVHFLKHKEAVPFAPLNPDPKKPVMGYGVAFDSLLLLLPSVPPGCLQVCELLASMRVAGHLYGN